jgi:hypothetical protein
MPTIARRPRPNKNATGSRRAGSARAELFAADVRQAKTPVGSASLLRR